MSKKNLATLRDFSLGINDKDAPNLLPDNALVEAQNAIVGKGFVSKRHGYKQYGKSPDIVKATVWTDDNLTLTWESEL